MSGKQKVKERNRICSRRLIERSAVYYEIPRYDHICVNRKHNSNINSEILQVYKVVLIKIEISGVGKLKMRKNVSVSGQNINIRSYKNWWYIELQMILNWDWDCIPYSTNFERPDHPGLSKCGHPHSDNIIFGTIFERFRLNLL